MQDFANRALVRALLLGLLLSIVAASQARAQLSVEIKQEAAQALEEFLRGDYQAALDAFQKSVDKARSYQPTADDYLNLAINEYNQDKLESARAAVDKALQLQPENPQGNYILGRILERQDQTDLALDAWLSALAQDPTHEEATQSACSFLYKAERYQDLIRLLQPILDRLDREAKTSPKGDEAEPRGAGQNFTLVYYLGMAYESVRDFERAKTCFTRVLSLDPGNRGAHERLFNVLQEESGSSGDSLKAFEQLALENPLPMVRLSLAEVYLENGLAEKALPILDEVSRANVDEVDHKMIEFISRLYARAEAYDQAVRMAIRASKLYEDSEKESIYQNIGDWLVASGHPSDGLPYLDAAVEMHRRFSREPPTQLNFLIGNAYHKLNDMPRAELYFRQFLADSDRLGYSDPKTLELLADIYESEHNYARAAEHYRQVVDLLTRSATAAVPGQVAPLDRARLKLAKVYFQQGQEQPTAFAECIAQTTRLLSVLALRTEASVLLAQACLQSNQLENAKQVLRDVESSPDWSPEADFTMARVLVAQGQSKAAREYIDRACRATPADEPRKLLRARITMDLAGYDEARKIYEEVLKSNRRSKDALVGLAELESAVAKTLPEKARDGQLTLAVDRLHEAQAIASSDPEILARLGETERDLATVRGQIASSKTWWSAMAMTACVLVLVLLATLVIWAFYRQLWRERLLREVLHLESQLAQVIRHEAKKQLGDNWQLALAHDSGIAGRVSFKFLLERAQKSGKTDALEAANFGHLVAIVDEKWSAENLRFDVRAHSPNHGPSNATRDVVVAHLNLISACRAAHLAHATGVARAANGAPRGGTKHMVREVRQSISIVNRNFDLDL